MKTWQVPREERACIVCGRSFLASKYDIARGYGETCSKRCAGLRGGLERAKTLDQDGPKNHRFTHGLSQVAEGRREYERRGKRRYPLAYAAKTAVMFALRRGDLLKQPCERCGAPEVQAHHDDYREPLAVRWLCKDCHVAVHKELRAMGISVRGRTGFGAAIEMVRAKRSA